jgi:sterol O-acyltransferase
MATEPPPQATYKADDRFETATGTLVVSKPYRSSRSKKLRAVISFIPRNSAFDINNVSSSTNEFRVYFSRVPWHLPPLTTSTSSRASLRSSGYLYSSSPFRVMYEVSRPVVVLSTFALQLCSHKTLSPLLSVMLSLLLVLEFVCHSPRP